MKWIVVAIILLYFFGARATTGGGSFGAGFTDSPLFFGGGRADAGRGSGGPFVPAQYNWSTWIDYTGSPNFSPKYASGLLAAVQGPGPKWPGDLLPVSITEGGVRPGILQ
jgi:hypothetical protein